MKKRIISGKDKGDLEKRLNEQFPDWHLIQVDENKDYSVSAWIEEPNYKLLEEFLKRLKE